MIRLNKGVDLNGANKKKLIKKMSVVFPGVEEHDGASRRLLPGSKSDYYPWKWHQIPPDR